MTLKTMLRAVAGGIAGAFVGVLLMPVIQWTALSPPGVPEWGIIAGGAFAGVSIALFGWRRTAIVMNEAEDPDGSEAEK
jgi:hypothetical protein